MIISVNFALATDRRSMMRPRSCMVRSTMALSSERAKRTLLVLQLDGNDSPNATRAWVSAFSVASEEDRRKGVELAHNIRFNSGE